MDGAASPGPCNTAAARLSRWDRVGGRSLGALWEKTQPFLNLSNNCKIIDYLKTCEKCLGLQHFFFSGCACKYLCWQNRVRNQTPGAAGKWQWLLGGVEVAGW